MKVRKFCLISSLLIFACAGMAEAQQMPQYTQYTWNDYMINPAVAGTHNYLQVRAFSRMQWMGIDGAPQTYSISAYGPTEDQPMGYGGYIYSDYTGPTSRLVFKGSYAYNIPINSNIRISGGISLGGIQYKVDGTQFDTQTIESYFGRPDPVIDGTVRSRFIPDASAGIYVYSTYFFAGVSAHQLIGNKLNKITPEQVGINRLKQHFYLAGGYNFILNRDFTLQPSLLVREMFPATPQLEVTARAIYQRIVWAGLSFRTGDAFSFMAGYNHENRWYFGLSYDFTYSQLRQYSGGSIEVMFGLKFDDIK
ncbi:MAG: type IX secretion system membrane protein PorP/SprF [Bacteroidales bacterium]|nr:type IX secretion system membrane protein PorP/SprF [Bacteroidales bacterium]